MLKALLKKQFLEMFSSVFQNRKTGKRRSKSGVIGYALLFVFVYACVGAAFVAVSVMLADGMLPLGLDWMYFALLGLMGILLGIFGSVFNTYNGLYQAKDNDLLLSMPIPPRDILLSRMIGTYVLGLLFESFVLVPAIIIYWTRTTLTVSKIILPILLLFFTALLVLVLTCLLGWVIALIASRLKNKSIITVILSLVFLAVYYWCCMNYYSALEKLLLQIETVSVTFKSKLYPIYLMGCGFTGKILPAIGFMLIAVVLFAIAFYILSRTFTRLVSRKVAAPKAVYKAQPMKAAGPEKALLRKELKRFTSSPTYMLNCGLGSIFMLAGAVLLLIYSARFQPLLELIGEYSDFLPIAGAALCMLVCMNDITAPSISLEGSSVWILQSLPVTPDKVFNAKEKLHWIFTMPPMAILNIALSVVLKLDFEQAIFSLVLILLYVIFAARVGLVLNLKLPNLSWTSEVMPIKQGLSVGIALFGGWIVAAIIGVGGWFALKIMSAQTYLLTIIVLLALLCRFLSSWLRTKGSAIFAAL